MGKHTHVNESKGVDGPKSPVTDGLPDHLNRKALSVVHVRLGRIVTQDAVDHNDFLAVYAISNVSEQVQ